MKYFCEVKSALESEFCEYYVTKNYKICIPVIGSFEVRLDGTVLYSKLETKRWPKIKTVINNLK